MKKLATVVALSASERACLGHHANGHPVGDGHDLRSLPDHD